MARGLPIAVPQAEVKSSEEKPLYSLDNTFQTRPAPQSLSKVIFMTDPHEPLGNSGYTNVNARTY